MNTYESIINNKKVESFWKNIGTINDNSSIQTISENFIVFLITEGIVQSITIKELKQIMIGCAINHLGVDLRDKEKFKHSETRPAETKVMQRIQNTVSNLKKTIKDELNRNLMVKWNTIEIHKIKNNNSKVNIVFKKGNDAEGTDLEKFTIAKEKGETLVSNNKNKEKWARNEETSNKAKSLHNNVCLIHKNEMELYSFLSYGGEWYTEGHHIIPFSFQGDYKYSIDKIWNIIPLCPKCHSKIHNGTQIKKHIENMVLAYNENMTVSLLQTVNELMMLEEKNALKDNDELIFFLIDLYTKK